jgi:hypothetical protein
MKVVIRPMGRHKWSGAVRFKGCNDYLGTYLTRSGVVYTGLSKEDTLRLGDVLGINLSPSSDFWTSFTIPMGSKDMFLDTQDPMDELKYLFLKSHKRVQSSITDIKPGANYVIINKDNEAKEANKYGRIKRRAALEFDKLTIEDMRKCLRLYGYNSENSSNEIVESTLFDLVEGNPQRFLDKWVDNKDKELEVLLETALSRNVIRRNKNMYKYGNEVIASSKDMAVAFLKDPHKADIRRSIMIEIERKPEVLSVDRPSEINEEDTHKEKVTSLKRKKIEALEEESGPSNEDLIK